MTALGELCSVEQAGVWRKVRIEGAGKAELVSLTGTGGALEANASVGFGVAKAESRTSAGGALKVETGSGPDASTKDTAITGVFDEHGLASGQLNILKNACSFRHEIPHTCTILSPTNLQLCSLGMVVLADILSDPDLELSYRFFKEPQEQFEGSTDWNPNIFAAPKAVIYLHNPDTGSRDGYGQLVYEYYWQSDDTVPSTKDWTAVRITANSVSFCWKMHA